jgi:hypothetical protein
VCDASICPTCALPAAVDFGGELDEREDVAGRESKLHGG